MLLQGEKGCILGVDGFRMWVTSDDLRLSFSSFVQELWCEIAVVYSIKGNYILVKCRREWSNSPSGCTKLGLESLFL